MGAACEGPAFVKVLINAISIKEGGSRVVLTRLLRAMAAQRPDVEWHAALHPRVVRESPLPQTVVPWAFPWVQSSPLHLMYWYEIALPRLIRRLNADILFSQTNYLPRRRLDCPSLLLEQHAGHFSAEFQRLMECELGRWPSIWAWRSKNAWVRSSVHVATRVTVQTAALANAIHVHAKVPHDRIDVVPHGPGLVSHANRPRPSPQGKSWRMGYVTKIGVQKDFTTALRAHRALVAAGRAVTLVLTLDPAAPGVAAETRLIDELAVGAGVENHGELDVEAIQALYDGLDIFVFPSLCESFGFPLVEAMARGVPVVVARTASNVEVGGDGVLAFAPGDWRGLADAVVSVMSDPGTYEAQSVRSLASAQRFSWDRAAAGTLDAIARTVRRQ